MKGIFLILLLPAVFINFSSSRVTNNINENDLNDLKYPPPLDLSNIFPFGTLRTLFNFTSIDQENGTKRLTSQMSSVINVIRRIFRFMLQNALARSTSTNISTTEKFDINGDSIEKVSIDLPVFSVDNDNDTEIESTTMFKNSTELSNDL
ncbi:hypothetical protein PVAND_009107 [Polypedilum vanderplanki]|uniref:Uncharacterized protein n=1 Tax=Polypedilum vanderplanki TaxID=319348 RepID=A0A9J6CCS1_POLVA|nr:hypothetical protein PVAND_009107 [Polypedilum vanderplanki]